MNMFFVIFFQNSSFVIPFLCSLCCSEEGAVRLRGRFVSCGKEMRNVTSYEDGNFRIHSFNRFPNTFKLIYERDVTARA